MICRRLATLNLPFTRVARESNRALSALTALSVLSLSLAGTAAPNISAMAEFATTGLIDVWAHTPCHMILALALLHLHERLVAVLLRLLLPTGALIAVTTTGARLLSMRSRTPISTGTLTIPAALYRRHHSRNRPTFIRSRRSALQMSSSRCGRLPLRRACGGTSSEHSRRTVDTGHWPRLLKRQFGLSKRLPVLRHLVQLRL